jgi:LysM repeat protein
MTAKLVAGLAAGVLVIFFSQACIFGGDDDGGGSGSAFRPGAVPTATLPANLPDPILLGQQQASARPSAAAGSNTTYVTQSGDTLGSIAVSQGVPPDQQAAWIAEVVRLNNIADARLLAVGVELVLPRAPAGTPTPRPGTTPVPQATPAPATTPQAAGPTPTRAAGASGRTYTVVSGDYPLLIAEKLGVPSAQQAAWANELVTLNDLDASSMVVGTVLQLPAGTP